MANEVPILNGLLQSNLNCNSWSLTGCAGITLTAGNVTLFQAPSANMHAATKLYVDGLVTGAALTAGRGIVLGAGPTYAINFAQNSNYTVDEIPFATGLTTMGFSSDLSWDDTGKVLTVNGELETITGIQFDTASPASSAVGKLVWNNTDKTLEVQVSTDTTLQIGQEDHVYATNDTGSPMPNGTAVAMIGAVLGRPELDFADITPHGLTHQTIGVTTEAIATGNEGFVTVRGFVRGLNTNAWNEGDLLYITGPGTYSNSAPAKPAAQIEIGIVITKSLTDGVIYVKPNVYPIVDDLSDYVPDAGVQAGSIFLRDATDSYWTDGGSYLRWVDTDKALRVIGAGPYQLDVRGGNISGYNAWKIGGLGATAGVAITARDTTASAQPDRQIIHVDTVGTLTIGNTSERTQLTGIIDLTNGYGVNSIQQFFVETASPAIYLKQTVALGTYKYGEINYGSPDRFRINMENLNPPSVVTVLDLNLAASPSYASVATLGEFRCNEIVQGSGYDARVNLIGGGLYVSNQTDTTTIALASTWYALTSPNFTSGGTNGVTVTTATGRLTPTVAGTYFVMWSLSFYMGSSNQEVQMAVLKNGTGGPQAYGRGWRKVGTGTDTGNANGHCLVSMNGTTDYIQLGVYNGTAAVDLTCRHMQLTCFRVGE